MPKFNHLMIDLETMGTQPTAAIVSIGAVFFDPETGELGNEFYEVIDLYSAMAFQGTTVDADTIKWWLKQSSEARSEIVKDNCANLVVALAKLRQFMSSSCDLSSLKVWGNGASFDNVILRNVYTRLKKDGIPNIWRWYNDRDVRTMVDIGRALGFDPKRDMPFDGVQHNALADAKHQAKYVSAIWQKVFAK